MPTNPDAELVAALEAARETIARVLHNNRVMVQAMRTGVPLSVDQVRTLEEQLEADERDLARFAVRVQQLRSGQAVH